MQSVPTCRLWSSPTKFGALLSNATTPGPLGTLGAGQTTCMIVILNSSLTAGTSLLQQAQSDRVTWRYVFTGEA